jgi:hypothetical protein
MDGFGRLSVLQRVRHLRCEILKEAAPAGDVDGLHPAADTEDRKVACLSEVNQVQLEIRTSFADEGEFVALAFSVEARWKVGAAAGQQEPVDAFEQVPPPGRIGY